MKCISCNYEFGEGTLFCGVCSAPLVNLAVMEGGLLLIEDTNQAILQRVLAPDYRVQGKLADGGMACVYHIVDNRTDESMAFKVLPLDRAGDPETVAQFERESRLLAELFHPHIIPIYDAGEIAKFHYLAMPMMAGDLKKRIEKGLRLRETLRIFHQVLGALAYAHDSGLTHRDIKPANILFDESDNAHLADFGIAWLADEAGAEGHGQGLGTPTYASPEQLLGEKVGPASDIYSLGVVFYEMLTGQRLFTGANPKEVVLAHLHQEPTPPSHHNTNLPPSLETLVLRMLTKNFEDRFLDAHALQEHIQATPELYALFEDFSKPAKEQRSDEDVPPPRRPPMVKAKRRGKLRGLIDMALGRALTA
ncbi:serine/threonine protein kinase [Acanthopleuribacter pedis]|uniref:non-specific serine/threonine protein kinase n=1 Tax=Acanthopleuribacter pedis TaxID=442870 RepID=A0A8J7Q5V4_9BACT|nr:serine/threonine-protein kinase [Acanthopleuribacter pedis]MBO1318702.1 serine/threonine protein kinase [Acanthopleuribacter pedis]